MPRLAITIDDVPSVIGGSISNPEAMFGRDRIVEISRGIVDTLVHHETPATAFINSDFLDPDGAVLRVWCDPKIEIGNHTAAHLSFDHTPFDRWVEDVQKCHRVLTGAVSKAPRYFRYPYLRYGRTPEIRAKATDALSSNGYLNAPVSVPTSDWVLVKPYEIARKTGRKDEIEQLAAAFVDHIVAGAKNGREFGRQLFGREVDQILLFHASTLTQDHLGSVLQQLRGNGFELISLEAALKDPVYGMEDLYLGSAAVSWMRRVVVEVPWAMQHLANWNGMEELRLSELFTHK